MGVSVKGEEIKANRLSLSAAKTEFMVIGSHQRVRASGNKEINVETENQSRESTRLNL